MRDDEGTVTTRRVFLVDDAPDIRFLFRLSLEQAGHVVVGEAATAFEALATAPELTPDVVLIDYTLPDRSGAELIAELRPRLPTALLILCSGRLKEELDRLTSDAGADGHIVKSSPDVAGALDALLS